MIGPVTQSFHPEGSPVPESFEGAAFRLRMLTAADAALDYRAVMASRDLLLMHSGGRWPRDAFSQEDCRRILAQHEAAHRARKSFTFTVVNPAETECLGCVYFRPLASLLDDGTVVQGALRLEGPHHVCVSFWVTPGSLALDLDLELFAGLRAWLDEAWSFDRILYVCHAQEEYQRDLFEQDGLTERGRIAIDATGATYCIYE